MLHWLFLSVVLTFGAALLFYNSIRFSLPVGYAGLYTQMSEQIAAANFRLPEQVPFYGPGGIPFAYPPFALYLMAIPIKLDISPLTYLRFVPPVFSILALIPLYFSIVRLTGSQLSAGFTSLFLVVSPLLYETHTTAAGIVRGVAFFLLFCGIYFYQMIPDGGRPVFAVLSGILFGLSGLTHLGYGLFSVFWVVCFALGFPREYPLKLLLVLAVSAMLIAVPWVTIIVSRYGLSPFINAFGSHGNTNFLDFIFEPFRFLNWISLKLWWLSALPLLGICAAAGLFYFVWCRKYGVVFLFCASLILLSVDSYRLIFVLAAILAGASILLVTESRFSIKWLQFAASGFLILSAFQACVYGIQEITQVSPKLRQSTFELGSFVQNNFPRETRYLFVGRHDEAEWLPYILQREPLISIWGSEWLGTYDKQSQYNRELDHCQAEQDLKCIQDMGLGMTSSDLLITRKGDRKLSAQLAALTECRQLVEIDRYLVWSGNCINND